MACSRNIKRLLTEREVGKGKYFPEVFVLRKKPEKSNLT